MPQSDFAIDDISYLEGTRGTGSKNILIENAFLLDSPLLTRWMMRSRKGRGNKSTLGDFYDLSTITSLPLVIKALRGSGEPQRGVRGIHMLNAYIVFEFDTAREIYDKGRVGLPIGDF